jgi:hypothetical protein
MNQSILIHSFRPIDFGSELFKGLSLPLNFTQKNKASSRFFSKEKCDFSKKNFCDGINASETSSK